MQEWPYLHLCSCSHLRLLSRKMRHNLTFLPLLLLHFLHTASHFCQQRALHAGMRNMTDIVTMCITASVRCASGSAHHVNAMNHMIYDFCTLWHSEGQQAQALLPSIRSKFLPHLATVNNTRQTKLQRLRHKLVSASLTCLQSVCAFMLVSIDKYV